MPCIVGYTHDIFGHQDKAKNIACKRINRVGYRIGGRALFHHPSKNQSRNVSLLYDSCGVFKIIISAIVGQPRPLRIQFQ